MNILLMGEFYSENLGDPVLCETVASIIDRQYRNANIIPFDISGKISFSEYYIAQSHNLLEKLFLKYESRFEKILSRNILYEEYRSDRIRFIRTYCHMKSILDKNKIDLAIFAGGQLFLDYFSGILYILVKQMKNVPIVFHACGMGNLSKNQKELIRRTMQQPNVISVSVRDSYDKFVEQIGETNKVKQTFDTALLASEFYFPSSQKIYKYGVGVISRPDLFEYQKKIIEYFIKNQKEWIIITNGSSYDYNFAISLLKSLNVSEQTIGKYLHPRPRTAQELVTQITKCEKIISFRMHSQIIALSFGIPAYGFVWDDKVRELYQNLNLSKNYGEIKECNWEKIFEVLKTSSSENIAMLAHNAGNTSKEDLLSAIDGYLPI